MLNRFFPIVDTRFNYENIARQSCRMVPRWRLFTGSIARSANCRYLIYSEADFEIFRPAGATRCTHRGEIWQWGGGTGGPLRRAKFHPMGATTSVYSPKTEIFTHLKKMWNINAPQQRIPYAIFTKICRVCTPFQGALSVKIWLDFARGIIQL